MSGQERIPPSVTRAVERIAGRLAHHLHGGTAAAVSVEDDAAEVQKTVEDCSVSMVVGNPDLDPPALRARLADLQMKPEVLGCTRTEEPNVPLAVLRGRTPPALGPAPRTFRVVAVIMAYNEADFIGAVVSHLVKHGVEVYLIDNWSTDGTEEVVRQAAVRGLAGVERFPASGPSPTFDLGDLLRRVEALALELGADWVVSNDADEVRLPPWRGVTLRDALWHAHELGFSAVNYTTLNFALTEGAATGPLDPDVGFRYFDPHRAVELGQLNTWRQTNAMKVDLASTGRHSVAFPGRVVFPYNFLLKHYPIRSLEQGTRKVNQDRIPRFRTDERLLNWHNHYRRVGGPSELLADPGRLDEYTDDFDSEFLLERLTGVGFDVPPKVENAKLRLARYLRRAGLLDTARRLKWRLAP